MKTTRWPMRNANPDRREILYARQFGGPLYNTGKGDDYGDFIRRQPCCACGKRYGVQAHHHVSRGAGGTWRELVPLDSGCHLEVHAQGTHTFQDERGISFREVAERLVREYESEHPEAVGVA